MAKVKIEILKDNVFIEGKAVKKGSVVSAGQSSAKGAVNGGLARYSTAKESTATGGGK